MGIGLPSYSIRKIIFVLAILFCCALQEGYSQSAGNVAFTGFNGEGSDSQDGFAVVLLSSVSGNQKIHFTSEEWNGSSFAGSGGSITWEAPASGISAGSVLVFKDVEDTPSVNIGTITDDTNMNLSGFGDVIYAFLGPDKDTPSTPTEDAFLGAIASASDLYRQSDGIEGTLANTGLTEAGNETILLPDNIDNAEYIGDRSGNTTSGYLSLLNDVGTEEATEDNWDIYNGEDIAPFPPFDKTSFTIELPPTIAFTSLTESGDEGTTVNLEIELVEANGEAVDVDVAFLSGSSTATNGDDFTLNSSSYITQTVSFSDTDASGTTRAVPIDLEDDTNFEGSEKAVFRLQNISTGTIINSFDLTLTIDDNDNSDIVINEIHADSDANNGDADGNSNVDSNDDEFVEFVNNTSSDIDVSGWTFSDETSLRHTFPDGTVIPANGVLVLFGDDEVNPKDTFGGAIVQSSNESLELGLNNGGDTIYLKDDAGNEVINLTYPDASNDQTIVRDPEITGSSFVDHSTVSDNNNLFSPGTKVDGTAFGSKYAMGIRGSEGWRMISSPTQNTSFADLFSNLWMQGVTGSDNPSGNGTLFSWDETGGGTFSAPNDMGNNITTGKGYIVYVFEDDEFNTPGIQGGFPKVINTDNAENSSTVSVNVSASDNDGQNGIDNNEGWNLLGNPFGTDLSVGSLISAIEDVDPVVNANIYVWDNEANSGNGDFITLSDGDRIAPFQAFFVRFTNEVNSGTVTFDKNELEAKTGTEFYKNNAEDSFVFNVELHGKEYFDSYSLEFSENGTVDLDRYDAYKLFSLNPNSINLFSIHGNNRLQKNELPKDLETSLEIPFSFDANGHTNLTFRWDNIDDLPSDWDIKLIDKEKNREIDLHVAEEYQFTMLSTAQKKTADKEGLLNKRKGGEENSRFVLSVSPNFETSNGRDIPESVKLNPNYPNPFNPTTTIPYEIAEGAEVKLTVWNMIGQKVATLVDGMVEAGTHEETWNANNMPSGIYIARFEVGNEVFTRKMTLIK